MRAIHYVFSTYRKKRILKDEIARELGNIINEICKEKRFKVICLNILEDHVHLLLYKGDWDRNEYVAKTIKGISSRRILKKYAMNRFLVRNLWSRGYRAKEVKSHDYFNRAVNYIKTQKINGIDKRETIKKSNLINEYYGI